MRLRWYYCCSVRVLPSSRVPAYCYGVATRPVCSLFRRYAISGVLASHDMAGLLTEPREGASSYRKVIASSDETSRPLAATTAATASASSPSTGTSENRQQERNPHITQTRQGRDTVVKSDDFQKLILVSEDAG